ncbi:hypothetical protein EIN_001070 [Entamoeba invadens IP1]|uniref:Leucine rich repeat containing protein BspA family protein n=1 Tax=Entamoeba invadens IP1 TaxID=370355 RepID=L7FJ16_ENTIV|nr:hypothetical protein EIN_001070 [Entamoeba invadens IP1]ELP83556.1 hypothetical protein EIN_001070 [Entamoeba invadens IP1]|eukprot:XP_004182902.1 hypothetical protein EIN_001070 [Entamoeba invadens IP1]
MSRLSGYHIMIVSNTSQLSKTLLTKSLFTKNGSNMKKFHFNPIPLNSKTIVYFPKIETLHLWVNKHENFGNEFMINTEENGDCGNKAVFKKRVLSNHFETLSLKIKKFGNNIPPNITSIGKYCFGYCSSLNSVNIPSSVTSINNGCFRVCSSLSSVTIPSCIKSIGDYCFNECINLTSITIPSSVISIGIQCFLSNTVVLN